MINSKKIFNSTSDDASKIDLRIIKTRRAIYNALIELLHKKGVNKITVSELAKKAEINKGTFYLHYSDIYDLYQHALKEHFKELVDRIDFLNLFLTNPNEFSRNLVIGSFNNPVFESDPFFSKDNISFNQSAQFYFCNALAAKVLENTDIPATVENELKLKFIFSGAGSLLRYDSPESSDLMINVISTTIKNLFPTTA
ncbi:TetR/AcrR family transcriptional regulator [Anaerotignum propionicum]|uniref:DNA-binding transcriptional repressor AcrR n=1 Tax=Anaerotignum propionicum DSM 1682 TaxID=991789 RepID=A0A0X1U981_ANAPI|nr:TetR/AcrR family transcriptional regulator [Anaerotignum propionicum]AMJ41489.1 DNA-binding transcriptional repressor AcrR [Anaerotignum propionicum DSM 1682]MBE6034115.1 TetR/AcrR family transcriptional regulator [Clostridiales bacterium]SHE69716.1 transcriptional regulator, TetR family [[Clostridium] propionicum DSM 1682] [Anaerotignum propionicum DSM 1682]